MKLFRLIVFLLSFFLFETGLHAQMRLNEDSLWGVYNNTTASDSNKLAAIQALSWQINFVNPDSAIVLAKTEMLLAEKSGNLKFEADATNTIGVAYINKDDMKNALDFHKRSLAIRQKLNDKKGEAVSLNNIGIVYNNEGDIVTAIDYFQKSLKIKEMLGDQAGVAAAYSNLGQIYTNQQMDVKALAYFMASLRIRDSLQDKRGMEDSYSKIATFYYNQNNFETAKEYTLKSIALSKILNHKKILANNYENLGLAYQHSDKPDSAEKYFNLALKMREEMHDIEGLADSYYEIGAIQLIQKNYKEAIMLCGKSLAFAEETGYPDVQQDPCDCLTKAYEGVGDFHNALLFLKRSNDLKDSMNTLEKSKNISRKILQYEFEKRALGDSLRLTKENEVKDLKRQQEAHQQKIYTVAGGIAFVLMIIIVIVLFRGYREKQKNNVALEFKNKIITEQKFEVENQKILVEEKNKAVLDSINYAQQLQLAILPSEKSWAQIFPDSFIFYQPKDIVAGDFYWSEMAGDQILFAVADCTGHGVPGALVSVVCSNALNRAVKEFHLTDPGKILDKVAELVLETFAKSEKEVSDGMDISLCCLNKKTNSLQWAGANNPLWMFTAGDPELFELKADKQPVGYFEHRRSFTTHTLQLKTGSTIYLFTDGFADQFGGSSGKKFKYRQLKELLKANTALTVSAQKKIISDTFFNWKGNLEQVDDVCVIGIRI